VIRFAGLGGDNLLRPLEFQGKEIDMQKANDSFDDPLATVSLAGGKRPAAGDHLREALLAQTVGVLRYRRRLKRCAVAASLLGCYLAGVTTMGMLRSGAAQEHPSAAGQPTVVKSQPAVPHVSPNPDTHQVAARKPSAFESWRNIGDHYLRQSGDVSLAVAGYSEALNLASAEERRISPGRDNWLMMALKDARSQEKTHACPEQN
jgi:hypothetical protein